jgi:hypothetical protein
MGAIAASFTDKSEPKSVIANGVKINGEKYMTIEASDDSLKAKKVRHPYNSRPTSIRLAKMLMCDEIGQGGRRSLQDNPSAPDRTPQRRGADDQRLQQRRRAGRVPEEGWLLDGIVTVRSRKRSSLVHTLGIFA